MEIFENRHIEPPNQKEPHEVIVPHGIPQNIMLYIEEKCICYYVTPI